MNFLVYMAHWGKDQNRELNSIVDCRPWVDEGEEDLIIQLVKTTDGINKQHCLIRFDKQQVRKIVAMVKEAGLLIEVAEQQ